MESVFFEKVVKQDNWKQLLSRFMTVLRMNIFIIDRDGKVLLPARSDKYGEEFLKDAKYGFDFQYTSVDILDRFSVQGRFMGSDNNFGLHTFAIPLAANEGADNRVLAFLMVGPVILNKRLDHQEYLLMASKYGAQKNDVIDKLSEIRVVSNLMMNSILGLLDETIRTNLLFLENEQIVLDAKVRDQVSHQKQHVQIDMNRLFKQFFANALEMTHAECGSLMLFQEKGRVSKLQVFLSEGLTKKASRSSCKIGEGVAGLVAQEKQPLVIKEAEHTDSRIKRYLKRPEIKEALVVPLQGKQRLIGVLNLHTKKDNNPINEKLSNLIQYSSLLSAVL